MGVVVARRLGDAAFAVDGVVVVRHIDLGAGRGRRSSVVAWRLGAVSSANVVVVIVVDLSVPTAK